MTLLARFAHTLKPLRTSLLASALAAAAIVAEAHASPETTRLVQAHVRFLADDLLEGRGTGTRGHELAMAYVAAQFERAGLEEAEPGTHYRQRFALRQSTLNLDASSLVVKNGAATTTLQAITDVVVRPAFAEAKSEVTAPAVFVGFGIHAPDFGYTDYAPGIDVRGKVAVILSGSPKKMSANVRAHFSRERTGELARRGAVAIITLRTPAEDARQPWAFVVNSARFSAMKRVQPDGNLADDYPSLRATASVSQAAATALFKNSPRSLSEIFAASERSEPQAFELGVEVTLQGQATVQDARSANVLAWLPGSDPTLAGKPIVVTAHLDHLGIGSPANGDSVYNGAVDNALGTAVMLAVAENLARGTALPRPLLFAAVTAEEKSLLGAFHLASHPPARVTQYAANLNIDMPVILAPVRDFLPIGAEHSTLGPLTSEVARRAGYRVSTDPQPEETVFVRSDQYAFIRRGVPSLFLRSGQHALDGSDVLATLEADFRRTHYHRPTDDLTRPIHWESAGAFADLLTTLTRAVAEAKEAPRWNDGDFFARVAEKP